MFLSMTWPDNPCRYHLDESHTSVAMVGFNMLNGTFSRPRSDSHNENVVFFYRTLAGAVAFNTCDEYVCIIDGIPVEKGEARTLNLDSTIQMGHYNIQVIISENAVSLEDIFYALHDSGADKSNIIIPEIEDILPSGAHYVGDLNYFDEMVSEKQDVIDVMKPLEAEYKKFLIWGHINNNLYDKEVHHYHHINDDGFFDAARSEMKSKTITECILDTPSLIDKVWDQLEVVNLQDEVLFEEEKHEILMLLAPEKFTAKEKKMIPELAFQDLYKIGLDSHY
ncbi:TagK domain-containing protein [Erwinia sorbitola]|uniref:TagK domain-containing protein n=1 Tax=Erwinia sorbitola TaxID=2681984 RepID=A0ABW9RFI8_9GAMM|nr:TagK domain-containing protein [Erwinia sorbitola]MTD28156.1 TagK domain-containing protein [Erwinia sorbitola]